jgi:serine/threonine protein kinase
MASKSPANEPPLGNLRATLSQAVTQESSLGDQTGAVLEIPDHTLLRCIGRGSYGEVWLARTVLGEARAVKVVFRRNFEHDRPYEREFEGIRKFEPISRLHDSQVDILQVGRNERGGYFYYVMQLADDANAERGTREPESNGSGSASNPQSAITTPQTYVPHTLKLDLHRRGRLPVDDCISIGLALTTALEHLHSHGLVHRDVKPSNIIFINGTPKLADIGLVASADATMSFVGTSGFLPPEGPGTPQGDLYSLGKVLYEISMGRDRTEFPKLPLDLAEFEDPARLLELNAIILKACHHDPLHRYLSAQETAADLALLQGGKSVKRQRALGLRWKRAKKTTLAIMLLAVLVASTGLALRRLNRNRPIPEAKSLYDMAVYNLQNRTLDGALQAYTNLTEAVKLDPKFVDAYFMLSEVYIDDRADGLPPRYSRTNNYRWALDNLRKVSRDSAQYHTANSLAKFWEEGKFEEAIAEVERALELDPKFQRAHTVHGWEILHARRDAATARAEFKAALLLGGADVMSQVHFGTPDYVEGNYKKAIEEYQKASWSEPRWDLPHFLIARAYEADKQYNKALEEYETFEKMRNGNAAEIETRYKRWRLAFKEKGAPGMWQAMLDEQSQSPSPSPYNTARLYARLGNTNELFVWLEKASREKNGVPGSDTLMDDCWDPFRDHPKYKELLEKMGFTRVLPLRR